LLALSISCRTAEDTKEAAETQTKESRDIQARRDFREILTLLLKGDTQASIDALEIFVKKYPENNRGRVVLEGLKKKMALVRMKENADALFKKKQWAKALPLLKQLRMLFRGERKYKEMLCSCEYPLELIEFNEAVKADDLKKALASGRRIAETWIDKYEKEVEPEITDMRVRHKIAEILAQGAAADTWSR